MRCRASRSAPAFQFLVAGQHCAPSASRRGTARISAISCRGILGEDARRIGHGDAALKRGRDVDIVDAVAEIAISFNRSPDWLSTPRSI